MGDYLQMACEGMNISLTFSHEPNLDFLCIIEENWFRSDIVTNDFINTSLELIPHCGIYEVLEDNVYDLESSEISQVLGQSYWTVHIFI